MKATWSRSAISVALLIACTPTEPCACPPSRTTLIVYGEVRSGAGDPIASAVVRYLLAPPPNALPSGGEPCAFDPSRNDADPAEVSTDASGRFRTQLYGNSGPGTRCLRVTAHVASAGGDTATVDGRLVPFRSTQPDSVGVVLTIR